MASAVKVPISLQPLLNATQREIPSLLKQLQVGQILPAKVLAQVSPRVVRMQIATTELLARTPIPLDVGSKLRLEVVKRQALPELRILREPTPSEQRQRAIRSAVAQQLPPREVRQASTALRAAAATPTQTQGLQRLETIQQTAGVRPEQLTARQIQRAVTHSGVFHEARLLSGVPTPSGDIKAQLLLLLKTLTGEAARARNAPPPAAADDGDAVSQARAAAADSLLARLIRLIEGSVARIQLQQSAALPNDDNPRQAWQLDLPIQLPDGSDDVMLRIERDASGDDDADGPGWSVNLAFEFDTIGTLQCRIGLHDDRVATTFWCDNDVIHTRLEQRLPVLKHALEAQGLDVVHLAGVVGAPADALIHVPMTDTLLDEHA